MARLCPHPPHQPNLEIQKSEERSLQAEHLRSICWSHTVHVNTIKTTKKTTLLNFSVFHYSKINKSIVNLHFYFRGYTGYGNYFYAIMHVNRFLSRLP